MKKNKLIRWAAWALLWSGLGYGGPLSAASASETAQDTVEVLPPRFLSFDCSGNRVTSLDVRGCASLTDLNCQSNVLMSLDVSGCDSLRTLHAEYNPMPLQTLYKVSQQRSDSAVFYMSPQFDTGLVCLTVDETWDMMADLGDRMADIAGEPTAWKLTRYAGENLPDSLYRAADGRLSFPRTGVYRLVLTNAAVLGHTDGETVKPVEYKCNFYVCDTLPEGARGLKLLHVSGKGIKGLQIPSASGLWSLQASGNRLPLSALAELLAQRSEKAAFRFDPQSDSVKLAKEEVLDLGSEWEIGGVATQWTLYPRVSGADKRYTCSPDGEFRFHEPGDYRLELKNESVCDYGTDGLKASPVTFAYYITVTGTRPSDTTASEATLNQETGVVYTRGRTICLSEDMGEVIVYTQAGQKVYEGRAKEIPVARAGFYIVQAGGRRFKVVVR